MMVISVFCLKTTIFSRKLVLFSSADKIMYSHLCWLQWMKLISSLRNITCFLLYRDFAMDRISFFKDIDHMRKSVTLNLVYFQSLCQQTTCSP